MSTADARAALMILALAVSGCIEYSGPPPDGFDRGLRSTNLEEISDLRTLMTRHGVPYRDTEPEEDRQGFLYRSADESRFASLRGKLDRQVSVKYREPEAREHLQKLLTEMKHDFIVSEKPDGVWIKWFPESDQQHKDVHMKVVQHIFALKGSRAPADCPPSPCAR